METQAYDLVCKENRDFLYEREGMPGINPNFVYMNQEVHTLKMASETRIVPDTDKRAAPKKPRKRNSDKDRLRTEAEQTAYKKLKDYSVPKGSKEDDKITDSQRGRCVYSETPRDLDWNPPDWSERWQTLSKVQV